MVCFVVVVDVVTPREAGAIPQYRAILHGANECLAELVVVVNPVREMCLELCHGDAMPGSLGLVVGKLRHGRGQGKIGGGGEMMSILML